MTRIHRPLLALLAACLLSIACSANEDAVAQAGARCAHCGMRVDPASPWRAGATAADGSALAFDAPKCLLRVLRGERGRGARDAWVMEYYSGERRPAEPLFYVLGSDVLSPMGRDLVAIEGRDRAERFRADHHGERVLAFAEIDAAILDALFRP